MGDYGWGTILAGFLLAVPAVFLAWYIPGSLLLRQLKLSFFHRLPLALIAGLVLWGWQGYVFGSLNLRWLSYPYLAVFFILWLRTVNFKNKFFTTGVFKKITQDRWLLAIFTAGVILQLSILIFMATPVKNGLLFCCADTNDNFWFTSLTNQLVKNFPPQQPGMAGIVVQNYHWWSNLVVADLVRVFRLPLWPLQIQFSAVFLSVMLGVLAVQFGRLLKLGNSYVRWLTFFLYFGADAIFWLLFLLGKGLNFSMSSLEDGVKFLGNLPRAWAVTIFFAGLNILIIWLKKQDFRTGLLLTFIFGSLTVYKVYLGIFAFIGLGFLAIYYLTQKNIRPLALLLTSTFLAATAYLPTNSLAGGLYFTGLWRFHDFIIQPALGLVRLELAYTVFKQHGNRLRMLPYEVMFFSLYFISIFGTKLLGFFQSKKSLSRIPKTVNIFLIPSILVSLAAGFFFQQKVGTSNTFNFLVSAFIIGSIYTALACDHWLSGLSQRKKIILAGIIILITVPRVLHEGIANYRRIFTRDALVIPWPHLLTFSFIKKNTGKSALLAVDYEAFPYDLNAPAVSIFTERQMFYSGGALLSHFGVPTAIRSSELQTMLSSTSNASLLGSILLKNSIDYVLILRQRLPMSSESARFFEPVFANSHAVVYKVLLDKIKEYILTKP